MKKTMSVLLSFVLLLSIFSIFSVPSFAAESTVKVSKVAGELTAPGTSETYLITDTSGAPIEDFAKKYSIEKNLKLPLSFSGPRETDKGTIFEIKVLDTCSTTPIKLEGTVTIKNLTNANDTLVAFKEDGTRTIKNSVTKVTGDISITTSSGSRLYDFSGSMGNINVYFGEDASIRLGGLESGNKCLAYNIDPNQNIKSKYSLKSSDAAFINFIGEPEFSHNITVKFAVPVSSSNPKVYQLKEGSNNELQEIAAAKVTSSGADEYIYFETDKLASTYVITAEPILGVEALEPPVTEPPFTEPPETEHPKDEETTTPPAPETTEPEVNDDEKSPQTGSNRNMYVVTVCVLAGAVAVLFVARKKNEE